MDDARSYLELWLTHTDPTLRKMWADTFQRNWDRLDGEQRATLKAEALECAPKSALAEAVETLPE
jgi:hypothetical protein